MSLDKYKVQNNGTEEEIEIVNYYNDNYEKIGTISRKEGIKQNLLLEAVQLWIINPYTKQVLMQKIREAEKESVVEEFIDKQDEMMVGLFQQRCLKKAKNKRMSYLGLVLGITGTEKA